MRLVALFILAVCTSTLAIAGAWPRADGTSFVALSFSGAAEIDAIIAGSMQVDPYISIYAEHGLTPRLTVGLDAGMTPDGEQKILAFARYPIGPKSGPTVMAIKAGLGAQSSDKTTPIMALGLDIGRGFTTPIGGGWLSLENWIEYRIRTQDVRAKSDLTVGLSISERTRVILQLQGSASSSGDPTLTLAPSVAYSLRDSMTIELGVQAGLIGKQTVGVKLGTWLEF